MGAVPDAVTGDIRPHRSARIRTISLDSETSEPLTQFLEITGVGASLHRPALVGTEAARLGFEPRLTDPESVVLPLHYQAVGGENEGEEAEGLLARSFC
jgi:hypothetical protein